MKTKEWLTAEEMGERIGVKPSTVKAWAKSKRIPSIRVNPKVLRFDPQAVLLSLQQLSAEALSGRADSTKEEAL
jgi:excisionase family DNA binding protein